jgi:prepilin-type N-terminal cleavage/methylation domain-containing protein
MIKKENFGFNLIELSIAILIFCLFVMIVYGAKKMVKMARLANAINVTAQANFIDDDSLVLWLETSEISKNNTSGTITSWKDLSKNKIEFNSSSGTLTFADSTIYPGIKAIKFVGTNYLKSSISLNLNQYTSFIVANVSSTGTTNIYDSGFVATANELSSNNIVVIKNDGSNKYIKSIIDNSFTTLSSNADNLTSSPSEFYIGNNGFKGEILEIIIFNDVLNTSKLGNVENYLLNKY